MLNSRLAFKDFHPIHPTRFEHSDHKGLKLSINQSRPESPKGVKRTKSALGFSGQRPSIICHVLGSSGREDPSLLVEMFVQLGKSCSDDERGKMQTITKHEELLTCWHQTEGHQMGRRLFPPLPSLMVSLCHTI